MSDKSLLPIPPALYDYVLFNECALKDWSNLNGRMKVCGDGSLRNYINWNSTYSYDSRDTGGPTLFGVTEFTWSSFASARGLDPTLNNMGRDGWHKVVENMWNSTSYAAHSASYGCGFILFQMQWGGFNKTVLQRMFDNLKKNADIPNYNYTSSTSYYKKIADATHAYTDPMVAYNYMRNGLSAHYYNLSGNAKYSDWRCGWMKRSTLSFTLYGLYMCVGVEYTQGGLSKNSSFEDWENVAVRWAQENKSGYVKIFDWGASPESIAQMSNSTYNYNPDGGVTSSGSSSGSSYNGAGGVYQLGNYTNAPDAQIVFQQAQNRDEVLNTLIGGSYTPDKIKKCAELITSDKKKGIKTKSES